MLISPTPSGAGEGKEYSGKDVMFHINYLVLRMVGLFPFFELANCYSGFSWTTSLFISVF